MATTCNLAERQCQPCEGGVAPLDVAAAAEMLQSLPGWALDEQRLEKSFVFRNHYEAMAFVNAVAWVSHRENHHPELTVGYKDVRIRYWTHAIGGLSENDFICAAKVDKLFDQ
ncbi:4a-hydroxytetrahydrobiopterin dehydratase [Dechloromonas sp. XY25]|uniref:Putative pterin-4-alpha-carbinolamine dehydratase n=1 Tax=Dechloromonas hankyongensis TaxID=2908002 RepID=A0ABS9JZB7_9RHOO|nr:4a-hydroxytetrahydrobiopterin dehydratase [Dechloromonas hankyongensis]MCG2576251.1 4a-hydroxytetrahydrobiopterin dehydratase [Dechloromonas hankyongensis]